MSKRYDVGYTTGVFDMFHVGHLNILQRAKERCNHLIVGVSTDELVMAYKNKAPIISYDDRKSIVEAIKYVDQVVPQDSMDKLSTLATLDYNVVFVGSDWKNTDKWNKYQQEYNAHGVDVVYLDHTDGISSSMLREKIAKGVK